MSLGAVLNKGAGAGDIPSGLICMWSGSEIPEGWFLCDGQNGTPDLRNRFIVGSGNNYKIGNTGGSDNVTLTSNEMPNHTHNITSTITSPSARVTLPVSNSTGRNSNHLACGAESTNNYYYTVTNWNMPIKSTAASTGGSSSHENRPPYYALAFIMKS